MPDAPIADRLLAGDRRALARLITWAESADPRFEAALERVWERVGRAFRVGVTGPPGAGKSTLVDQLARLEREHGRTVGILAVDPSSPFTGGALLGDRIRMEERTLDPGVFIRSMASRDAHGGLARAAIDACDAMDAFGLEVLLLETVGVGQAEYDVMGATDCVVVTLCPGAGDGVQAMKAGLLEVADVLVVNKAELPGADRLALDLEEALDDRLPRHAPDGAPAWRAPVVACSAARGTGVEDVRAAVLRHRAWQEQDGRLARARAARRAEQVRRLVVDALLARVAAQGLDPRIAEHLAGGRTPYRVARTILEPILAAIPYPGPVPGRPARPGRPNGGHGA